MHMDLTEENCLMSSLDEPIVDSIIDFDDIKIAYVVDDLVCIIGHCMHTIPKIHENNERNNK